MCRQEIPRDYLDKPKLLEPVDPPTQVQEESTETAESEYSWFYEGRDGNYCSTGCLKKVIRLFATI